MNVHCVFSDFFEKIITPNRDFNNFRINRAVSIITMGIYKKNVLMKRETIARKRIWKISNWTTTKRFKQYCLVNYKPFKYASRKSKIVIIPCTQLLYVYIYIHPKFSLI